MFKFVRVNIKTAYMTKPEGVPAEAIWVAADNEWELGKKNSDGENVGEWKWWLAPNGHLCCHTFYDDEGEMLNYTRYHPDGTFSQKCSYEDGERTGDLIAQRSVNATSENAIPPQAPENVFKMIHTYDDGDIIATKLFDVDGNELDQHGNLLNPVPTGDIPKDATWDGEYQEWEHGKYKNDQKEGVWKYWQATGELSYTQLFINGVLIEENHYFPNGETSYIVKYNSYGAYNYRYIKESEEYQNSNFPTGQINPDIAVLEYCYDKRGYMTHWKGIDEEGTEVESAEMYYNLDNRHPQTKFASEEEAAKMWNSKGKTFYKEMTHWLGQYYDENSDVVEGAPEPSDSRMDMERFAFDTLEKYNNAGTPEKVRALILPSYEPISKYAWENLGKAISKILAIDKNTILSKVENTVYLLSDNKIEEQKDLIGFGASKDKRYIAKCLKDKIEITIGWSKSVVTTLKYPTSYGESIKMIYPTLNTDSFNSPSNMGIRDVKVFDNGKKAVLVTDEGVFILSDKAPELLYPHRDKMIEVISSFSQRANNELDKYIFNLNMSYINADISLDDQFIVIGGRLPSPHLAGTLIYKNKGSEYELVKHAEEESMFSIQNQFHDNGKDLLHGACMYASIGTNWSQDLANTTFRMNVSDIDNGEMDLESFAGGYRQAPGVVSSVVSYDEKSFALGMSNDGYIWVHNDDSNLKGYLFVGGTITSLDKTADGDCLIAATNQGQIIKFKIGDTKGENLITNLKIEDQKRYLFMNGFKPMVW